MEFEFEASYRRRAFCGHRHYHDKFEFYYLESGRCTFLINDKLYVLQEGDLAIIPPGIIHVASYSGDHSRLLITCDAGYLEGLTPPTGGVYRNPAITDRIRALFWAAEQEYQVMDSYTDVLLCGILCQMVALIGRQPNYYSMEDPNGLIAKVLREINQSFTGELTLCGTACVHGITPSHLSRLFKREVGMSFNQYLSMLRLKKAEQLLREEPRRPVGDIAFSCGFNDSNYFSEKFRSVYGCSPSSFRKG